MRVLEGVQRRLVDSVIPAAYEVEKGVGGGREPGHHGRGDHRPAGADTELAKRCRFPRDCLPLVSVGTGVAFALLLWVASAFPASRELVQALVWGMVAGLTAAGLYDNYRVANPRWPEEGKGARVT